MNFFLGAYLDSRELRPPLTSNWKSEGSISAIFHAKCSFDKISHKFCWHSKACLQWRQDMAVGIHFIEETGRRDVQRGGERPILVTDFGLFSSLSKGKIYFFLLFTTNLSYFNSFKLPHKIGFLASRPPLRRREIQIYPHVYLLEKCTRQIIEDFSPLG